MICDSFAFAKECRITFDEDCDCVDAEMIFDYGIKLMVGIFDDMDCVTLVSRNGEKIGQYMINGIDKLSTMMIELMDDIKSKLHD